MQTLNFGLRVEYVELGDHQRVDAIEHFGIAQHHKIEPAAAARASGDGAKLIAARAHFVRVEVGHLGGKRTAADARGVGLGDADDAGEARRGHTEPVQAPPDVAFDEVT